MPAASPEYLVQFGKQGLRPTPNRWRAEADQLYDASNVAFDRDFAHRPATLRWYDAGGVGVPVFTGTWSAINTTYTAIVGSWPVASTGVSYVGLVVAANSAAQASPWVLAVAANVPAGGICILSIGSKGVASFPVTSVTDSKGNTWVETGNVGAVGGGQYCVAQYMCQIGIGQNLVNGVDTITVTWAGAADAMAVEVGHYANFLEVTRNSSVVDCPTRTSTAISLPCTAVGGVYPQMWVATVRAPVAIATSTINVPNWNDTVITRDDAAGVQIRQHAELVKGPTLILAQHDFESYASSAVTGTVSMVAGTRNITGVATLFNTEMFAGDHLLVDGEDFTVEFVSTAFDLVTVEVAQRTAGGLAATRLAGPKIITAVSTGTETTLYKEAPVGENPLFLLPGVRGDIGDLNAFTLINTLRPSQRRGRFVECGKEAAARLRKLIYISGSNSMVVLAGDGAVMAAITAPAADWTPADPGSQPINAIVHRDRLWAFGNLNDAHRAYYSNPADHEDFTTVGAAGSMRIASQIGRRLYGAATFRGVLFLWKYPKGIFYIDDTDLDYANWSYRIHSAGLGCAPSPHAVLSVDDDVLFMDPNGHLHLLSAVDTLGGVSSSDLTRQFDLQRWTTETIDRAALNHLVSAYNPRTKMAYFGCQRTGSNWWQYANDLLLIVDFSERATGGPIRMSYMTACTPNSLAIRKQEFWPMNGEQTLLVGETNTCYIALANEYGQRQEPDADRGYEQAIETPELDLGDVSLELRTMRKQWRTLRLVLGDGGLFTETATVSVYVDGVLRQTLLMQGTNREIKQTLAVGDGYTIKVRITTSGASAQDIQFLGLGIGYHKGGEDQSRKS